MQRIANKCLNSSAGGEGGAGGTSYAREAVLREEGFDPYARLGLEMDADARAIRSAYRKLAATWHPDKWSTSGEAEKEVADAKFKEIKGAYEALLERI